MSDFADTGGTELFDDPGSAAIIPAYMGLHTIWDGLDSFYGSENIFRDVMSLSVLRSGFQQVRPRILGILHRAF